MNIIVKLEKIYDVIADAVVMFVFSDEKPTGELKVLDNKLDGHITKLIESGEISGKYREFTLIHTDKIKASRILLMGLGKKKEFEVDKIRSMSGRSARILRRINLKNIAYSSFTGLGVEADVSAKCITEGILLGLYHFKKYKTKYEAKEITDVTIIAKNEDEIAKIKDGIDLGVILAESTILARDLTNEPGNIIYPETLAAHAARVAEELNLEIEILDEVEMERRGMGAIMSVGKGSIHPPRMAVLKYTGKPGAPLLALVGKGITFDSGGLSIKTGDNMNRMYDDCAGACSVLGAVMAIAKRKLPCNVLGIMAMAENMPSGHASRPGDIVKSYSGKTIEILSTDAEGRLVLADALTLAQEKGANYLVDIATLTGGCVVALGYTASGIMGNDEKLIEMLKKASVIAAEQMWQLPLYDDYFAQIYSDVADMENSGGRAASACTAGKFLEQFIKEDVPWVHIDIAGTAMIERERTPYLKKPYLPKEGATGVGVRTLYHLAELISKS